MFGFLKGILLSLGLICLLVVWVLVLSNANTTPEPLADKVKPRMVDI